MLKSKNLIVSPMNDDEIKLLIEDTDDIDLKAAYSQMLDGGKNNPADRLWYTAWRIALRDSSEGIGNACFMGKPDGGAVEVGYGIDEIYRGKGYATEAMKLITQWAFCNDNVYFVQAETEETNIASRRVLEKLGFKEYSKGDEGPRFILEKPKSSMMAVFMCLGLSVGMAFGTAQDNAALGMTFGLPIGMLIGLCLDNADNKKREELRKNLK